MGEGDLKEMGEGDLKEMVEGPPGFVEKKEKHDQKQGGIMNMEDDDVTTTSGSSLRECSRTNSQGSTSSSSSSDLVYDDDASSSTSNSSNNCHGPLYELSELMAQLPIKRGLSKYFQGKSQSFASIISSVKSIEDLAKKESPYRKKMKACKSYGGGGLETHKLYTLPRPTISKKVVSRNSMSSLSFPARRSSFLSGGRPPLFPVQKNF